MELMVALAILLGLVVILVPATMSMLAVRQRQAATQIVTLYQQLHDEAVLNNYTFRVAFDLLENKYKVETGLAAAVIYATPEEAEAYHEELLEKKKLMSEEELAEWQEHRQPFERVRTQFDRVHVMPPNVRILGVYTPQYGKMMTLEDIEERAEEHDDDLSQEVVSYVFSNGFMEHTVIWVGDPRYPEDGFTIVVEPLSGAVTLHGEIVDWESTKGVVPESGPSLPT